MSNLSMGLNAALLACALAAPYGFVSAEPLGDGGSLAERGEYIARAADCMSCHVGTDGVPFAGGRVIETPLGGIVAPNITPSDEYGIGQFDVEDFRNVLREGKAPDHMLYPAMPYAYYRGMSDEDISALWAYLQTIEPVERAPEAETDLPFPFNIRASMRFWNMLALDGDPGGEDASEDGDPIARGRYLVEVLGHCGACHTPRNGMMIPQDDRHLGGANIQGWEAPNITPSETAGLGRWEAEDIVEYLRTGQALDVVQAAGPMAEVVHFSTRHLAERDLHAIARYLKSLPPLETEDQQQPLILSADERPAYDHAYGEIREEMRTALALGNMGESETLFVDHCAACHGVEGEGQSSAYYPPLLHSATLRRSDPTNLVQVITHGISHEKLYRAPPMPGFGDDLSDAQIASLANYTRTEFGGFEESEVTAQDVRDILNPKPDLPFYIEYAATLVWIALAAVVLVLALAVWLIWRKFGGKGTQGADNTREVEG